MTDSARPDAERFRLRKLFLTYADRAVEAAYRTAQRPWNLRQTRLAFLYAILLNLPFAGLDLMLGAAPTDPVVLVRVFGVSAYFGGLYLLARRPGWEMRWPLLTMLGLGAYTLFYGAQLYIHPPYPMLASGYAIVLMGGYVLFPFFFRHGVEANLLASAIFFAMAWGADVLSGEQLVFLAGQLATVNAICIYVLYRQDLHQRQNWENLVRIDEAQRLYRQLLLSILPQAIAERLSNGEREIAERYEDATVLFADLVGFTGFAAAHPPEATAAFLNRLFRRFDILVARHGLEKIKTIGDSYMAAGGVPEHAPDHTDRVARLALDMMAAAAEERWPDGSPLALRIGLHSGSLVAGVIGDSRFLYDLWGDTVNVASRMESAGEPGSIQVSERVQRQLDGRFRLRARGAIAVKGLGEMRTWYLEGEAAPAAAEASG